MSSIEDTKKIYDILGNKNPKGVLYYSLMELLKYHEKGDNNPAALELIRDLHDGVQDKNERGRIDNANGYINNQPNSDCDLLKSSPEYEVVTRMNDDVKNIICTAFLLNLQLTISEYEKKASHNLPAPKENKYPVPNTDPCAKNSSKWLPRFLVKKPKPTFFHLVVVITADKLPENIKSCHAGEQSISENTLKSIVSKAKRIRITQTLGELKNILNNLKLDEGNQLIDRNQDWKNILVVLGVHALPSITQQKTAMGILEQITLTKDTTFTLNQVSILASIQGAGDFVRLI